MAFFSKSGLVLKWRQMSQPLLSYHSSLPQITIMPLRKKKKKKKKEKQNKTKQNSLLGSFTVLLALELQGSL
jgi:hypothetical protein